MLETFVDLQVYFKIYFLVYSIVNLHCNANKHEKSLCNNFTKIRWFRQFITEGHGLFHKHEWPLWFCYVCKSFLVTQWNPEKLL